MFGVDLPDWASGAIEGGGIGGLVMGPMGTTIGGLAGGAIGGGMISSPFGGHGSHFQATNPGQVDLSQQNPALWAQIQQQQGMLDQFKSSSANALDPARYAQRSQEAQDRASTATMNRFGAMGLAGTSAAMGTANEQSRQVGMQWQDRQLSDQIRSLQMEQQMSQGVTRNILAGQAQFGSYQNMLMNRDAQAAASDAAMWGSIFGAMGSVGGAAAGGAFGGPMGARAGGAAGGGLGQAAAYGSMGSPNYQGFNFDDSYANTDANFQMPGMGSGGGYNPNF